MRTLAVAAVLLSGSGPVWSAPTAPPLLVDALKGPRVPFDGTQKTTIYTDTGSVSGVVRVYGNGKGSFRREYRTGAAGGVTTLQKSGITWERSGSGGWVKLPGADLKAPAFLAAQMARNYRVSVGGPARLCGRTVRLIRIDAVRPSNPSRRIWLDTSTGILVRDDLLAPDGKPRSSSLFTQLRLKSQPGSLFTPPGAATVSAGVGPSSFTRLPDAGAVVRATGFSPPRPDYVPPGFTVETYGMITAGRQRKMPAVRYSDGLAAFSIFRRGVGGGGPGGPGFGRGGRRGWGGPGAGRGRNGNPPMHTPPSDRQQSVVSATRGTANYLLVGDISEAELQRVADTLP